MQGCVDYQWYNLPPPPPPRVVHRICNSLAGNSHLALTLLVFWRYEKTRQSSRSELLTLLFLFVYCAFVQMFFCSLNLLFMTVIYIALISVHVFRMLWKLFFSAVGLIGCWLFFAAWFDDDADLIFKFWLAFTYYCLWICLSVVLNPSGCYEPLLQWSLVLCKAEYKSWKEIKEIYIPKIIFESPAR